MRLLSLLTFFVPFSAIFLESTALPNQFQNWSLASDQDLEWCPDNVWLDQSIGACVCDAWDSVVKTAYSYEEEPKFNWTLRHLTLPD